MEFMGYKRKYVRNTSLNVFPNLLKVMINNILILCHNFLKFNFIPLILKTERNLINVEK